MALLYTHKHTYVSTVCSGLHLIQLTLERDLAEVSRGVVREFWQTTHTTHKNTRRRSDSLWERVLPQQGIQPIPAAHATCALSRAARRVASCALHKHKHADGPG